ncbi:rhamnan synthesis F family protein [Aminobacter sp. AP02]|uniref:rhamnan synthesis F family protein n=1 Tax=Aminobacter sp. AP02 TaxID=2135737 RepID=UPI000D6BD52A|nr:rhamnan synthesis F family protein [Aminobacter sp. AP02]PWK63305.1 rhamnan synthesis protein F [Aminobacter sp. AP02]
MQEEPKVAIVVHAFHMEVFEEILGLVRALPARHKLFVTTVPDREMAARSRLEASGRDFALQVSGNRGRDVLPFLRMFPILRAEGFDLLVKVHTKKSSHRADGDIWRRAMLEALLLPDMLERSIEAFRSDPSLGIVGPDGHFLSIANYIGGNRAGVLSIGSRLGLSEQQVLGAGFFAGTMFMARGDALQPIIDLNFQDDDFEAEDGQVDSTLAHALERSMMLGAFSLGRRVASSANPAAEAIINDSYDFARKTNSRSKFGSVIRWMRNRPKL